MMFSWGLFHTDLSNSVSQTICVVGIVSGFGYDVTQADFINQLTTPYGTTTFVTNASSQSPRQFVIYSK